MAHYIPSFWKQSLPSFCNITFCQFLTAYFSFSSISSSWRTQKGCNVSWVLFSHAMQSIHSLICLTYFHNFNSIMYADDYQVYIHSPVLLCKPTPHISNCLTDLPSQISLRYLKFNKSKSELLPFPKTVPLPVPFVSVKHIYPAAYLSQNPGIHPWFFPLYNPTSYLP